MMVKIMEIMMMIDSKGNDNYNQNGNANDDDNGDGNNAHKKEKILYIDEVGINKVCGILYVLFLYIDT